MNKKIYLLFTIATLYISPAFSQNYNFNFEDWDDFTTYIEPTHWSSFNTLQPLGLSPGTLRTTDAVTGAYAVQLVTGLVPVGVLVLGRIYPTSGVIIPGEPWNAGRPDSVKLFFKDSIVNNDSSAMVFLFTRWDAIADTQILIGNAVHKQYTSVPNYIELTMPVNYLKPDMPDSLGIILSATANVAGLGQIGTTLWIDDIRFTYPINSITEVPKKFMFEIFPNPATKYILIELQEPVSEMLSIDVFDITSKLIERKDLVNQKTEMNLSSYPKGIYNFILRQNSGAILNSKKVVVE